jgi:hypothetical protein
MLSYGYGRINSQLILYSIFVFALFVFDGDAQTAVASPTPLPHKEIHRWFDIEGLTISTRYRFTDTANGTTVANQQQWQLNGRGRFKFDAKGKYSVVVGIESGNALTGGWNNLGPGTGDLQTNVFVKQLYFDAKPVKPIEIQFGGIGFNNGENTEITGYDNDAYLTGERIIIRHPKQLWFDEISLTNGYVGDVNKPSIFRRLKHLDKSNYHQILVRKRVNGRVSFSADYTFESGIDRLRQAVKLNTPEVKIIDSALFEDYQQLDPLAGYGFAISFDKRIGPKFNLVGGFSKISHTMFNGDRFPVGERLFLSAVYKLTRELNINPVIIRAVGPLATPGTHRTRFELIASYNVLEALRHYHLF